LARRDLIDPPVAGYSASDDEQAVYRERARRLGLPFAPTVALGRHPPPHPEVVRRGKIAMEAGPRGLVYIAPDDDRLPEVGRWLMRHGKAVRPIAVATPTAIRAALMEAGARHFVAAAVRRLEALDASLSARHVLTRAQRGFGIALAAGAALALWLGAVPALFALNLFGAFFFFGVTLLRFIAAGLLSGRRRERVNLKPAGARETPVYTVLVPLAGEERIVEELVADLRRLDWPADRLDIKIIVEGDDRPTRRAVERAVSGPPIEIVVVPPSLPRTKPKALAYALTFARGRFVTIYDAEDRPHPMQLREAFAAFSRAGPEVACLQAPIVVDNAKAGWIAQLFSMEYSALFDGLLPALAALGLPLPLGGTSNHFRREALEAVGGWDPFNVTEDADLGIRLARFGFRSATLRLPTYEEAPIRLMPWLRQRSRWFKGWMQTWLVHMRRPVRLVRAIGLRQFTGFSLVGIGMIVSALFHPVYLLTLAVAATDPLVLWGDGGVLAAAAVGINLFNLFAGYIAVAILSRRTLALRGRKARAWALFSLPAYWLLMSVACCLALFELAVKPHHWAKTPHRGRRGRTADAGRSDPASRRSRPLAPQRLPRRAF
jgi:cellulose synthase/poly-beta-1,6-N-acetylglucosamine synthase-like glycosyltransferase